MDYKYEENIKVNQIEKVKKNKDWLNILGRIINFKNFEALHVTERIGDVKERNKKKTKNWWWVGRRLKAATKRIYLARKMVCFWLYFWWFLGSGGVLWGHGWATHPGGMRMGWADAEKLGFEQI